MKKLMAALLTFSMVFSLTACNKNKKDASGSNKLNKTTGSTETDETSEEPADSDPTDTKEESTTDESTDPSVAVTYPITNHDLTFYQAMSDKYYNIYGALDPNVDSEYDVSLSRVVVAYDVISVFVDEDVNHTGILDKIDKETFDDLEFAHDWFETDAAEFAKKEQNGEDLVSHTLHRDIKIYRSDSKVFSYVSDTHHYGTPADIKDEIKAHNIDSETLKDISFSDVILDKDALIDYVQKNLSNAYVVDSTIDAIKNETLVFGILYDGIYIHELNSKIPAYRNESMFNMKYFDATPEYYTLLLDHGNNLDWDIDADGKMDRLSVALVDEDTLKITVNGQEYKFGPEVIEDRGGYYFYDNSYLVYNDKGCYLFVAMSMNVDDYSVYAIFEMKDGKPEFRSFGNGWVEDIHDPNYIAMGGWERVLGFTATHMRCAISSDGTLTPFSALGWNYSYAYLVNHDLKGHEFDCTSMDIGEEVTIKKGSKVTVAYGSDEAKQIVLRVLDPDLAKQYDVIVETDGNSKICGMDCNDALTGILWAG
ncbi:MAG: hypothetical protein J6Y58_05800 [Clostridiales bacterium]|nr:hypothetical protein [Clostridiales bacterium]